MMTKKTTLTLAAAVLLLPSLVMAKDHDRNKGALNYTGPVANVTTVAESLENTGYFGETDVILEGKIIKQIDARTFIFQDKTGTVEVEIKRHAKLPKAINENTQVRIFGELEGGSTPEVEVKFIKLI